LEGCCVLCSSSEGGVFVPTVASAMLPLVQTLRVYPALVVVVSRASGARSLCVSDHNSFLALLPTSEKSLRSCVLWLGMQMCGRIKRPITTTSFSVSAFPRAPPIPKTTYQRQFLSPGLGAYHVSCIPDPASQAARGWLIFNFKH
jgi:hypothetical protein